MSDKKNPIVIFSNNENVPVSYGIKVGMFYDVDPLNTDDTNNNYKSIYLFTLCYRPIFNDFVRILHVDLPRLVVSRYNKALNDEGIDANYFQHIPYLNEEVSSKNYQISPACTVHYEPLNLYSAKSRKALNDEKTIDALNKLGVYDYKKVKSAVERYPNYCVVSDGNFDNDSELSNLKDKIDSGKKYYAKRYGNNF